MSDLKILFDIIEANFFISLISLSGAFLLLKKDLKQSSIFSHNLVSFSAGVMLSAALLLILPEAIADSGNASLILKMTLLGLVFGFILERTLIWQHHHHDDTHNIEPTTILVLFGDAIHNFVDGVAIAATFIAHPALGFATTLAIAAHEIPQELADFTILSHCGMKPKKALFFNFLSALTAIIGGIVGFYFLQLFDGIVPLALGLTAGIFIYIPTADLIPELHSKNPRENALLHIISFILGIGLMLSLSTFVHEAEVQSHTEYSYLIQTS